MDTKTIFYCALSSVIGALLVAIGWTIANRQAKPLKGDGRRVKNLPRPQSRSNDHVYDRLFFTLEEAPNEPFSNVEIRAEDLQDILTRYTHPQVSKTIEEIRQDHNSS